MTQPQTIIPIHELDSHQIEAHVVMACKRIRRAASDARNAYTDAERQAISRVLAERSANAIRAVGVLNDRNVEAMADGERTVAEGVIEARKHLRLLRKIEVAIAGGREGATEASE